MQVRDPDRFGDSLMDGTFQVSLPVTRDVLRVAEEMLPKVKSE